MPTEVNSTGKTEIFFTVGEIKDKAWQLLQWLKANTSSPQEGMAILRLLLEGMEETSKMSSSIESISESPRIGQS